MSNALKTLMQELDNQKKMYHQKMLSVEGEETLFYRSFQVYDLTMNISLLLIPEFYYAATLGGVLLGLDLNEIQPFNIDFTWRTPTLDEWLKGVNVVIEKTTPNYAVPLEDFVKLNIKPEYQQQIMQEMISKGYYGISRYDYAYYDPAAVREFLRNTIQLMFKKHAPTIQKKTEILSLAKTLNILEDLARELHDRMSMIMSSHIEYFILDYGILDVSILSDDTVPFINLDGEVTEAKVDTMADMQYGFILDISLLDYGYLLPDEDIYEHSETPYLDSVDDKLGKFKARFSLTPMAFSNYVRGDETADYRKCERTEVWGELTSLRFIMEHEAEALLAQEAPSLNMFDRRKYITAVLQLMGHLGKRHEWGYNIYKAMEDEELKNYWLEYWGSMGLDKTLLTKLYDHIKGFLPKIVKRKIELGRKMRMERLGLPLE
jgi:hypothetical protein